MADVGERIRPIHFGIAGCSNEVVHILRNARSRLTMRLTYRRRGGRLSAKNILESGQRCERKPRAAVRWSRLDRRFRFIWFWVVGYSSFAVEPSGVRSA